MYNIPVTDFLAMFCGHPFNVQVSQSFNDGHPDLEYHRGAAMTAEEEGLWDPIGNVSREEIRHMQARTDLYEATHPVGEKSEDFDHSPACANSWCRWVIVDSVAFAAREAQRNFPGGAPRQARRPAALPALGSTPQPSQSADRCGMTTAQRVRLENNKAEALQRKLAKEREQEIALLGEPDEEEDPFGFPTGFDD